MPAAGAESRIQFLDDGAGQIACAIDDNVAFTYECGKDLDLVHLLLRSPSGKVMTLQQARPPHKYPHHRSFWFADTVQLTGKRKVSFYGALYTGPTKKKDPRPPFNDRIRHISFTPGKPRGVDEASAKFRLLWEMDRKTPVLDEMRDVTVRALRDGQYFLDITFTVTATYEDVSFVSDATHYAWPYLRMTPAFSVDKGGTMTNSEGGVNQKGTHDQAATWVDYTNTVDGKTEGVAVFSHTDNAHPHKWLTRDYGTFGPRRIAGRSGKKFVLKKGESLKRRVGILVHNGDVKGAKVAEHYKRYVGGKSSDATEGGAGSASAPARTIRITVDAGACERLDTPVSVTLPKTPEGPFLLSEVVGGKRTPVFSQLEAGDPPRLTWILAGKTAAKATRTFELGPGELVVPGGVTVTKDDKTVVVTTGRRRALQYNHAPVPPPKGVDAKYTRSGFIHPLWSPGGAVLTQIHPKDHYHHLGLWSPWTNTTFEGRHVDFWNLKKGDGTVRFATFESVTSGPVFGGFVAAQEHVDLSAPGGEKTALNEKLDVRVWRAGKGGWLCDYVSTQRCASKSPLTLNKYRYGGFGFRGTEQWDKSNSDYLTSEGKTRTDGHATRSRWCLVYGRTDKGPAGVLFLSHPKNRAHPEPMRIWPQGNVFFNYCPIQKALWTLEPGKEYVLRYRMRVYDGKMTAAEAERVWRDFAEPPTATIAK